MRNKDLIKLIIILIITSFIFFYFFNFYSNKFAFTRYLIYLSIIPLLFLVILLRLIEIKGKIFHIFFFITILIGIYDIYENYPKLHQFFNRSYDSKYLSKFDKKLTFLVFDRNDHFAEILTGLSISNSNIVPYPIYITGYFREQNNVEEIKESYEISNYIEQNKNIKNKARLKKKDFKLLVETDDEYYSNLLSNYVINFSDKIDSSHILSNYDFRDGSIFKKLNQNIFFQSKFKFLDRNWYHYRIIK